MTPAAQLALFAAAPDAIQAAWRAWKRRYGGNDRTSDAFVAGWHAANAHQGQAIAELLERMEQRLDATVARLDEYRKELDRA